MSDQSAPSADVPTEASDETQHSEDVSSAQSSSGMPRIVSQLCLIGIAALAGMIGSQIVYMTIDLIPPPPELGEMAVTDEARAEAARIEIMNAAIGFALAGALISGAFGIGLWLPTKSSKVALLGAGIGVVAGLLLGGIGGALNGVTYLQIKGLEMDELFRPMLTNAPYWICLGISLALALAIPIRGAGVGKTISAGVGAAIVACLLYPLLAMVFFRAARLEFVIPLTLTVRVVWLGFASGVLAWAVSRSLPARA